MNYIKLHKASKDEGKEGFSSFVEYSYGESKEMRLTLH